jgi:hypothetical protein
MQGGREADSTGKADVATMQRWRTWILHALKALLMLLTFDSSNVQPKSLRKPVGMFPELEV